MDIENHSNHTQLQNHIFSLSSLAANLKLTAWGMFDYEWEKGRSAYLGNLLAELGRQCDIVTNASKQIVTLGELIDEELKQWEEK